MKLTIMTLRQLTKVHKKRGAENYRFHHVRLLLQFIFSFSCRSFISKSCMTTTIIHAIILASSVPGQPTVMNPPKTICIVANPIALKFHNQLVFLCTIRCHREPLSNHLWIRDGEGLRSAHPPWRRKKDKVAMYLAHILNCEMAWWLRRLIASNRCQAKFYLFLLAWMLPYTDKMHFKGSDKDTCTRGIVASHQGDIRECLSWELCFGFCFSTFNPQAEKELSHRPWCSELMIRKLCVRVYGFK